MSLPHRFKAGSTAPASKMMVANSPAFHHRSTTKAEQKPFKSRFATKNALKDKAKGKTEQHREDRGKRRTPHQQAMSKIARKNQAKQLRVRQHEQKEVESSIFQGPLAASKHIAIVPLSAPINVPSVLQALNDSVDINEPIPLDGSMRVKVERFRRSLLYLPTSTDLLDVLDTCRLADWVVLVLSHDQKFGGTEDQLVRALEGQGVTNVLAVATGLDSLPSQRRTKRLSELKDAVRRYFPTIEKVLGLDSKSDCSNLVRTVCTASSKGIRWRDDRSWMYIEELSWLAADHSASSSDIKCVGTVRGKGLDVNRLVHVPGWGDFQIRGVHEIPVQVHKRKADEMVTDISPKEWLPNNDQEDLAELAPEVAMDEADSMASLERKGVLLDDHHYFSRGEEKDSLAPKRLPRGTSSYQAAWYLDDVSDSDSDFLDEDETGDVDMGDAVPPRPEDGMVLDGGDHITEAGPSEYPESEMHHDADAKDEAEALAEFRQSRKKEADEDFEFPDEIELHPDVSARERLVKYRGLKDLRTSEWNIAEDEPYEPADYKRLLRFADYKKSRNAAVKEALAGGVLVGTRVEVHLADVSTTLKKEKTPNSMFSLLRHEHKQTVVNLNLSLHSGLNEPLKSKEEIVVQIGHRRLVIKPIFSAPGVTPNDVHKFDRFLHPGHTAIATFTGPLTWGSVPVLVFKQVRSSEDTASPLGATTSGNQRGDQRDLKLIGSATTVPPSHKRVIAKRVILTGHPYKIHKKLVTVRYMFFNREDIAWFAALPLWTKRGRQGFVKEALGTHGYFKATFDGKINPLDAIGMSLYKRVWPRASRPWSSQ